MKGILHNHSENSRYDSTMDVKVLCKRAKECGYEAVALTDHGTLTGIDDFIAAAAECDIKPIPGVEAYVQEDNSMYKRFHLILLAVDDLGYQGIGKAVSDSNTRIDSKGFPRMNKEILEYYFAEGKKYHGHVIATSACAGGVLAGLALSPLEFDKEILKLKKRQENYEVPESETYKKNVDNLNAINITLETLKEDRERLTKLSKRPFKKKEKDVEKKKGTELYEEALAELNHEKEETEQAKIQLEEIKAKIAATTRNITSLRGRIKDSLEDQQKYIAIQTQIDEIESKKLDIDDLYDLVKKEALYYNRLFGEDNFFIEIQYHGFKNENDVPIEKAVFPVLADIAKKTGIKL